MTKPLLLLCLGASMAAFNARCATACVYEGYAGGRYIERGRQCECFDRLLLSDLLAPKLRAAFKKSEQQDASEEK